MLTLANFMTADDASHGVDCAPFLGYIGAEGDAHTLNPSKTFSKFIPGMKRLRVC